MKQELDVPKGRCYGFRMKRPSKSIMVKGLRLFSLCDDANRHLMFGYTHGVPVN